MGTIELLALCIADRDAAPPWREFLRRVAPKIKAFIWGAVRRMTGKAVEPGGDPLLCGGIQLNDLFQTTILRLVENDCAALRRFSGTQEGHLMAYLAVIARSVVRDCVKYELVRSKHSASQLPKQHAAPEPRSFGTAQRPIQGVEYEVLLREVRELSNRAVECVAGRSPDRDRLIFQLYFFHDLSLSQIAECKGVNLSKAGVDKVLNRLMDRVRAVASVGTTEAAAG
ncbi:MAG: sigma-70 family RNA polymerase sigma factor [Acidobacteriota bacterium]